jgi:CBS domain-containing protein
MGMRARLHEDGSHGSRWSPGCAVCDLLLFSDIAKKVIGQDRAPERVNVYEIMAKPVVTVRPDMNIRYCARLFENFGIGHAPVEEDGKIIGMVSYYRLVLYGLPNLD